MNRKSVIFRAALAAALLTAIVFFALRRDFVQGASLEGELQRFGSLGPTALHRSLRCGHGPVCSGIDLHLGKRSHLWPPVGTVWNLTGATLGASLAFLAASISAPTGWPKRVAIDSVASFVGLKKRGGASLGSSAWCRCFLSIWSIMRRVLRASGSAST